MLSLTYRTITGKTNSFILFPGSAESSVGLLRKTSLAMAYSGPYQVVQGIVDAFNVSINIFPIKGYLAHFILFVLFRLNLEVCNVMVLAVLLHPMALPGWEGLQVRCCVYIFHAI